MKTIKSTKGFTLVELIVVIAILMILSVLAVSAFGNVMGQAQDAARRADAQALVRNINMFNSFATDASRIEFVGDLPGSPSGGSRVVSLQLHAGIGTNARGSQFSAGINMPFTITMDADRFTEITGNVAGIRIFPSGTGAQLVWTVVDASNGEPQPTRP